MTKKSIMSVIKALIVPVIIAIVFVIPMWFWVFFMPNIGESGLFGDKFGSINALFSGLAFVGLIYAILQQSSELRLQREELEMTREELRGQKEALQEQSKQITLQNFEGTFFQMLRLHNGLLNSIGTTHNELIGTGKGTRSIEDKGTEYFSKIWLELQKSLREGKVEQEDEGKRRERVVNVYRSFLGVNEPKLGHYFRLLYNIFKFVDESQVEDKKRYTNIVRAMMSSYELLVLMYNGIYLHSESKFIPYIEKYAVLKHVPKEQIPSALDCQFYAKEAFGGKYPLE